MKPLRNILAASLLALVTLPASALNLHPWDLDFQLQAGLNVGGASPFPIPAEIRAINSFHPNLNLSLGFTATKWLNASDWGVTSGLRFEVKSMDTDATVKNYGMTLIDGGKELSGRWTGQVFTHYQSQQLCVPVLLTYRCNPAITVHAGPYFAYALRNYFNGHVTNGYLREGDPTGNKVEFDAQTQAEYKFHDNLRKFQWGAEAGIGWEALNHLMVNANLEWGCNGIFQHSFKTISFPMYPIFVNVGFGYEF